MFLALVLRRSMVVWNGALFRTSVDPFDSIPVSGSSRTQALEGLPRPAESHGGRVSILAWILIAIRRDERSHARNHSVSGHLIQYRRRWTKGHSSLCRMGGRSASGFD